MRILVANYLDNRFPQLTRYRNFFSHTRSTVCFSTYKYDYDI